MNNKKLNVGYDYDGVLSDKILMRMMAQFDLINGSNVYIITKRSPDINDLQHGAQPVLDMAQKLGIPSENVNFTNNGPKSPIINQYGITVFYDDQLENRLEIESNTNCKVIIV